MVDEIKKAALESSVKLEVIPFERMIELKADIDKVASENAINGFQKWIIEQKYVYIPEVDFEAKSVVVAVWPQRVVNLVFNDQGKTVSCIADDGFLHTTERDDALKALFEQHGFHLKPFSWMPQKRLAVCAGLCEYGRNNITYCGEWGSFIKLNSYATDLPAEDYFWRKVVTMDLCDTCGKCIANCPTKAILPNRFLIDNEICLACLNARDDKEIPDWVPKIAHHRLIECTKCMDICPMNQKHLANLEEIEFSKKETETMLGSASFQEFPDVIKEKLRIYNNGDVLKCIPRNLRLMLDNA